MQTRKFGFMISLVLIVVMTFSMSLSARTESDNDSSDGCVPTEGAVTGSMITYLNAKNRLLVFGCKPKCDWVCKLQVITIPKVSL